MVDERGTAQQRIEGARALIAIADLVQFDRHLGRLLQSDVIDVCQDDMRATVDRGIRRVAADDRIPFDLDLRLALLTIAMRRFDEPHGHRRDAPPRCREPRRPCPSRTCRGPRKFAVIGVAPGLAAHPQVTSATSPTTMALRRSEAETVVFAVDLVSTVAAASPSQG